MPSPFPGMDPYLEDPAFWNDFHGRLIYVMSEVLLERLPDHYDTAVQEQVRLVEIPPDLSDAETVSHRVVPDVALSRATMPDPEARRSASPSGAATLEPVTIEVPVEREVHHRLIEISHRDDRTLVTVIELLSPWNKRGDGAREYKAKRRALLRQAVNLVELDLLVGGERLEAADQVPAGDYYALISKASRPGTRSVYAWSVQQVLPSIPIPLRLPDPDVTLDLEAAFTIAFERGGYLRKLRYGRIPSAPLAAEARAWAQSVHR